MLIWLKAEIKFVYSNETTLNYMRFKNNVELVYIIHATRLDKVVRRIKNQINIFIQETCT